MVFTSASFIFIFLPIFLFFFFITRPQQRIYVLLLSSYIFYGFWRLDFLPLLVFSTLVDYYCGKKIYNSTKISIRRIFLCISLSLNLGLLIYFKYSYFVLSNISPFFPVNAYDLTYFENIILPLGISFFTFQTMSYSIDIYRREVSPAKNILEFATYVSLFPQLIAGPIVRYKEIQEDFKEIKTKTINFNLGVFLFMIGFSKKVMIANNLAPITSKVFELDGGNAFLGLFGMLSYTFQIYFDFSGYSDMAIGLGYMVGFSFPINFNSPYKATSITDFWRRWHITLSRWFRDYLYISLGGNQRGRVNTYRNLLIVMGLCALWHGANWTFIIWGLLHGMILIFERVFIKNTLVKPRSIFNILVTFCTVAFLWIPFRSKDLTQYLNYLQNMIEFTGWSTFFDIVRKEDLFYVLIAGYICFFVSNSQEYSGRRNKYLNLGGLILFLISVHELLGQSYNPFLYFNF